MSSIAQQSHSGRFEYLRFGLGTYSVAMVIATLVLDILAGWLLESSGGRGSAFYSIAFGLIIGQLSFFVLLFGLRGKSWTASFLVGCFALLVAFVAMFVGMVIQSRSRSGSLPPDILAAAFVFPGAMFAAMSPLWLARSWFGWRLEQSDRPASRFPSSVGGLFINIVVLAGVFMLMRGAQVIWGFAPIVYWPTCGIIGVVIALVFAGLALPSARIVNFPGAPMQFASVALLTTAIWGAIGSLPNLLDALGSSALLSLSVPYSSLAISAAVATMVLALGVRAITADGFTLKMKDGTANAKPSQAEQKRWTRGSIAHAALVAAIAFAVNLYVGRIIAKRNVVRDAGFAIQEIVGASGKVADYSTGEFNPIRPALSYVRAPDATDADLERIFEILRNANALDGLMHLYLNGSQVTDKSVPVVSQATNLQVLDVSQTKVTGAGVDQLSELQLEQFMASDLDLTSAAWDRFNAEKLRLLTVSGSKFSTEAFASLLDQSEIDTLAYLNVVNTEIDDQVMNSIANLLQRSRLDDAGRCVYLSGTSISDKDIALLEGTTISRLYFGGTQVTDACVDSLAKINDLGELDISETNITDVSLPKLLHIGADCIIMDDTNITAKALLNDPSPGTRSLIVREGQFTTKELKALEKAGFNVGEDGAWLK